MRVTKSEFCLCCFAKLLISESALFAARRGKKQVSMSDFEDAKDKVMMGVERKSMILTPADKKIIAYHEAGHALVAYFSEFAEQVMLAQH